MKMKLKRTDFWVLVCDDWKYRKGTKGQKRVPLLCGVYEKRSEAIVVAKEIKDCLGKHYIKKATITADVQL